MIASYLRGYSWEPSPVFEKERRAGRPKTVNSVVDLRSPSLPSAAESARPARGGGATPSAAHLERYFAAASERSGPEVDAPESLYFVDATESSLREVVGFRMRGHPLALMGAFVLPRHRRSPSPNGRPSLASFLSKPPRSVGYAVDPTPPGHLTLFMPGVAESIPEFVARLRAGGGCGIHVAADVLDIAFDLRFANPSEIREHTHAMARPARSVFRTIAGHVVSGLSVGLHQTLHKADRFITLTDAVQHRPSGDVRLPTLAVNRSILALRTQLPSGTLDRAVRATTAFHPHTASDEHLLGPEYDV